MRPALSLFHGLRAAQPSLPRAAISRSTSRSLSQLTYRSTRPSLVPASVTSPLTIQHTRFLSSTTIRQNSSKPLTDQDASAARDAENEEQNRKRREEEPAYQIVFTCKPCGERSSHRMSKHGYHKGTVLIRCPSCQNRHVISDHLNIFFDQKTTLEDILAERGSKLTRGYVDGDMEFWDDGVAHKRGSGSESS
ncbi:DNL zinc finger domain protein [Aspergillus steynii IBT 23096]|uniref:DNL zinc finger domain protein n=1 Tax=Aspergillus steynii IBT 23096 TaxID=1392250 RepID=A0A2I2GR95_9EURO|nr:DNL zinc finger domain protein [Aspergillus steynii IBT 23096]PLB55410.1 DNL zinc finger domain protein [Aspergillus steynii IBT 23096]